MPEPECFPVGIGACAAFLFRRDFRKQQDQLESYEPVWQLRRMVSILASLLPLIGTIVF